MLCRIAKRLRFPRRTAVPVRAAARPPGPYPPDAGTGCCADAPRRSAYTAQARCLCAAFAQTDRHHSGKTAVTARKSDRRPDVPPSHPAPHSRCPPTIICLLTPHCLAITVALSGLLCSVSRLSTFSLLCAEFIRLIPLVFFSIITHPPRFFQPLHIVNIV